MIYGNLDIHLLPKANQKTNFMKKAFLALVVLTTTVLASNAQVKFGIKAGIGVFNLSGDDGDGFDSKVGPMGGAYAAIPIGETFAVAPELQFSGQGAKQSESGITAKFIINYVNIPVMLQYRNPSGFFAETGPQIGFRSTAKIKVEDEEEDYKDVIKSTAFSWGIGLGYRSSMGLGVSARYNLNLNSIAEDQDGESFDVKNSGFQVGLIFEFGGGSGNAKK